MRSVICRLKPTNTCCRRHNHGDEHMLLPRTVMWQRWPIVCGEGQEEAVINAQISASSAKHSAMGLTDDAASLPLLFLLLLSVFSSLFSDWDEVKITPEPPLVLSCKLCCLCGSDLFLCPECIILEMKHLPGCSQLCVCSGLTMAQGTHKVARLIRQKYPTKWCIVISKRDVCGKLTSDISMVKLCKFCR